MKSIGIVRKVDQLGRVTLPKEMRDVMNIEEGTQMEIYTDGNNIIISKYSRSCVFCGGQRSKTLNEISVCDKCINKLNA